MYTCLILFRKFIQKSTQSVSAGSRPADEGFAVALQQSAGELQEAIPGFGGHQVGAEFFSVLEDHLKLESIFVHIFKLTMLSFEWVEAGSPICARRM